VITLGIHYIQIGQALHGPGGGMTAWGELVLVLTIALQSRQHPSSGAVSRLKSSGQRPSGPPDRMPPRPFGWPVDLLRLAAVLLGFSSRFAVLEAREMYPRRLPVAVLALSLVSTPGWAATILPVVTRTIASPAAWPAPPGTADHNHGTMVNAGEMGVEDERGIVEFDLSAHGTQAAVLLEFDNAAFQTCCLPTGVSGGSYTVGVYAYAGDNAWSVSDFDALGTLVGSFSTAGLTVGTPFSFDVTAAFNANAGGSLGIRLQALTEPAQTSYTFNNFTLDTDPPATVPEPGTMLVLAAGVAAAVVRNRGRNVRDVRPGR
jgi:hypothetical protein